MKKTGILLGLYLVASVAVAYEFLVWQPDADLLAKVNPVLKEHCWNRSDQHRQLADEDVRIEVNADVTNIVVHMPDISVRDTFTIRGLAYTNYHRRITGLTEEGFRYLECLFSPTPITNAFEVQPMEFDWVSSHWPKPKPVKPLQFKVYVDVDELKAFDDRDWSNYKFKRMKTSNKASEAIGAGTPQHQR